jgi:uncharacterized protein YndB with AHSA1/START domain
MKVNVQSDQPVTDEACKAATGKTLAEWFAILDSRGGPAQGRREINNYLFGECKVDQWWSPTIAVEYENSKGLAEKDGLKKGYFICSTKTVNAPLEKVYASWASAEGLGKWFGGGVKASVVDGGSFEDADGSKGSYKRVRENKDLRFTWEGSGVTPGSIVDVQFQDKGNGKTGLLVNHDRIQTRADADGLRNAWGEALARLKSVLEG